MIYLGTPGRMVGIKCPSSQQVDTGDRYTFETTLEGARKAQAQSTSRRAWGLSTSDVTTPLEHVALNDFVDGAWGRGPFWFVSADAPVTNMLIPDTASCAPDAYTTGSGAVITNGGPLQTPDGWAPRSYLNAGPGPIFFGRSADRVPVIPGQSVTASVYVLGVGAAARLSFYNASGTAIGSSVKSVVLGNAGTVVRSFVTAVAPAGAATAMVSASDSTRVARPSLTWTDSLYPYAAGEGCHRAVVHAASKNVVWAAKQRGGQLLNASFTVTEVG